MRKSIFKLGLLAIGLTSFVACSDDESVNDNGTTVESKFIITATPTASDGVADYILTADDLSQGQLSILGNGIEQDGTYRYYVTNNNKFFSLLYGQGNPGAVTTYELGADGELDKLSNFQSETVQAFAAVEDDILLLKISRSADSPITNWYRVDTNSLQIVAEGVINTQDLADKENGELAFFSWITPVDGYVYLPYFSVKGTSEDRFGTDYPDEANVAVYTYPEMEYVKTITDDRISFIGRYFINGLSVVENGDAYAFSSSVATTKNAEGVSEFTSTKPSAITRIPNGTTEFDDFYFDVEEASGGKYVTTHMYLGNNKFLVGLEDVASKGAYSTGKEFAVIDVNTKSFTKVTGLPSTDNIVNVTARNNYVSEDGATAYIGVNTSTGNYIYNIDVATAVATQGLEIQGASVTAISKLNVAE